MLRKLFALSLFALCVPAIAGQANPDTLRVALLPDESPQTIIKENAALQSYLEDRLGKQIKLVVTTDYSSMIEAARFERIDLAYFGPLSYVLANKSGAQLEPFAAKLKDGETTYRSVLVGNVAAGVDKISDIQGKPMAYGDPASTSSHLIPKKVLLDAGLETDRDYQENFTGSHDAVATAVQNGHAKAGGLSKPIFESLIERGIISKDKVQVLTYSEPYPQYPWVMQSYLDDQLKDKIRSAFMELADEDILGALGAEGFGKIEDSDYDVVRDLMPLLD
ncbi:phosphate/phosphite/phosphonate ABC transporter substrate-binding protein [Endozoicomonas sp. G2_2]|uniref:phosphate/phosphite/phosphonate ABC transporter substrate-binding protein n=1 Tax=Endozoicomonas sp. G2_2 TaxID=2821092 RepID=UPI001ADCFF5D|nr:phosphate/phosphite/phosphonate ABC transporter substrate-binding protein [Endozoicomonas sp. G2_2]MBO9471070.1 phosphate/phosphite/phosphonate ABC transporter substrate-binding protein [Endozoicomonas sp. G2_2]